MTSATASTVAQALDKPPARPKPSCFLALLAPRLHVLTIATERVHESMSCLLQLFLDPPRFLSYAETYSQVTLIVDASGMRRLSALSGDVLMASPFVWKGFNVSEGESGLGVARVTKALASSDVSILMVSTNSQSIILVRETEMQIALDCLAEQFDLVVDESDLDYVDGEGDEDGPVEDGVGLNRQSPLKQTSSSTSLLTEELLHKRDQAEAAAASHDMFGFTHENDDMSSLVSDLAHLLPGTLGSTPCDEEEEREEEHRYDEVRVADDHELDGGIAVGVGVGSSAGGDGDGDGDDIEIQRVPSPELPLQLAPLTEQLALVTLARPGQQQQQRRRQQQAHGIGDYLRPLLKLLFYPESGLGCAMRFVVFSSVHGEACLVLDSTSAQRLLFSGEERIGSIYRAIRVVGEWGFTETGLVSGLSNACLSSNIPIFYQSTYSTDFLLVLADDFEEACSVLAQKFTIHVAIHTSDE